MAPNGRADNIENRFSQAVGGWPHQPAAGGAKSAAAVFTGDDPHHPYSETKLFKLFVQVASPHTDFHGGSRDIAIVGG